MLRRKIDDILYDWMNRDRKKSLIIEGPRQVGKTTSVVDFVKRNYEDNHIIYVNFKTNPGLIDIFEPNIDAERILNQLQIYYPNKKIVKGESVIILDDIQECERAIVSLKSFTSYGEIDVIAMGAFLENVYESMSSFPVGYVERNYLGSLDFEEYLWANGYDDEMVQILFDHYVSKEPLFKATHNVFMNLFREYMAIGGMPKVVEEYLKEHDFKLAYSMLEDILEDYNTDMINNCKKIKSKKVRDCYHSIPVQMYQDYKKFRYTNVSSGGRVTMYQDSVNWLVQSGIVLKANNLESPKSPLQSHVRQDIFKLYPHDPGLFVAMLGDEIQLEILRGGIDAYNGAVYEAVIASLLHKLGYPLYYFERKSKLHVDFLITMGRDVYALEVKTADHPKSKVMASMVQNYELEHGIRLGTNNISVQDSIITYPLYMVMFLGRT
jgi:predicted AAA+ superfamily ATPase